MSPRPPHGALVVAALAGVALACAGAPPRVVQAPPSAERSAWEDVGPPGPSAGEPAPAPASAPPVTDEPTLHAVPAEEPAEAPALAALREEVVRSAGARAGRPFRGDCSGYVLAALRDARVRPRLPRAPSRSEALFLASRAVERPRPGDLAFFHDTYDRNRDGRVNDRFTHVALVESVEGSAVVLLHRGKRGVERVRMDLARPGDRDLNDPIRVRKRGDAAGVRTLAGELFAAFGALLPEEVTQMLHPGPAS